MSLIEPTPKAILEALNEHTHKAKTHFSDADDAVTLRSYWYTLFAPLNRASALSAISIIDGIHAMGAESFPKKLKLIDRIAARFSVSPRCRGELTVLLLQAASVGNLSQEANLRALWELIKSKPFSVRDCTLSHYKALEYFGKNTPRASLCSENVAAKPGNIQCLLAAAVLSSSSRDLLETIPPKRENHDRQFAKGLFGQALDQDAKKRMMADLRYLNRHYSRVIDELALEYAQYLVDQVEVGATVTVDEDLAKFFLKGRRFEFAFQSLFTRIQPKDFYISYAENPEEGDAIHYPWDDSYPGKLACAAEMIQKLRTIVGPANTHHFPDWAVGAVAVSQEQEDKWIEKWATKAFGKTTVTPDNRKTFEHYFEFAARISNSPSTSAIELHKCFGFSVSTLPRYLSPAACILIALRYRAQFKHDNEDYRVIQAETVIQTLYSPDILAQVVAENARRRAAGGYQNNDPDSYLEQLYRFTGDAAILEHMPQSSRINTLEEDLGL
jgi:hypothetical protein